MKHPSVTAPKDGWAWLVNFHVNLGLQLVITFACVTCATMGLPVTCCAQTTVRSVLMGNVIADSRVGEDSTVRRKDVRATRRIAQDTDNVLLHHKSVSAMQAGVVGLITFYPAHLVIVLKIISHVFFKHC